MSRIFISYKRSDKKRVFPIRDRIEAVTGEQCWIDMDGIESDAQFVNVIMRAIDEADLFLFMFSKDHSKIDNFETDWTVREINYAQKKKKRIVIVNLDQTPMSDWFEFMFGLKQQVDATDEQAVEHLIVDICKWLHIKPKKPKLNPQQDSEPKASDKRSIWLRSLPIIISLLAIIASVVVWIVSRKNSQMEQIITQGDVDTVVIERTPEPVASRKYVLSGKIGRAPVHMVLNENWDSCYYYYDNIKSRLDLSVHTCDCDTSEVLPEYLEGCKSVDMHEYAASRKTSSKKEPNRFLGVFYRNTDSVLIYEGTFYKKEKQKEKEYKFFLKEEK